MDIKKNLVIFMIIGIIIGVKADVNAAKIPLINPSSATVGTIITVEGEEFYPGETVRIDLGGQFAAAQTQCDQQGAFSTSFKLSKLPGGVIKLVAVGFTSYSLVNAFITVKSRITSIVPSSGVVGTNVTIEGDGYGANEEIQVDFGTISSIPVGVSDSNGGIKIIFIIPPQSIGEKQIVVRGVSSGESNNVHFSIYGIGSLVAPNLANVEVFPNPFRPTTIHQGKYVTFKNLTSYWNLKIFNLDGELVDEKTGDTNEAHWYGNNQAGNPCASGVYIYLITNDRNEKVTGRVVVIR